MEPVVIDPQQTAHQLLSAIQGHQWWLFSALAVSLVMFITKRILQARNLWDRLGRWKYVFVPALSLVASLLAAFQGGVSWQMAIAVFLSANGMATLQVIWDRVILNNPSGEERPLYGRMRPPLRCLAPISLLVGSALLSASLLAGCASTTPTPRRCTHLLGYDGKGLALSPWDDQQCQKAQTKRDLLKGFAIATGALAGGSAASQIPDTELTRTQGWRIAWGLTTVLAAGASVVLGILAATAQGNLSDHCTEYRGPMIRPPPPPASSRPSSRLLLMREADL